MSFGQQRGVPGGTAGQLGQALVWWCAERVREHRRHRALIQRRQREQAGTAGLKAAEQVIRGALGRTRPGQEPRDRAGLQLTWQRPEHGQPGRGHPVQIVQADQDRSILGAPFEAGPELGDPPRRSRQLTTGIISRERPMPAPAQRGERDRPAQLARCSRGQEEAPPGGLAEQRGLADTRLPIHQQHAANPPLGALEQATGHHLLGPASVHHFPAGPSLRRHRAAPGPGALIIAVMSRFAEVSDHRSGPQWAPARIEARV
jgi:hypothetical protein